MRPLPTEPPFLELLRPFLGQRRENRPAILLRVKNPNCFDLFRIAAGPEVFRIDTGLDRFGDTSEHFASPLAAGRPLKHFVPLRITS